VILEDTDPEAVAKAPVVANPTEPVPLNKAEFKEKELDKALEPEITPVVVTAPELLIDIKVVDPDTKTMP
jgi:hypothetical protein